MPRAKSESWKLFIDTNVFLDFYRQEGESVGRQFALLEKHADSLILSDQIWMEFLKNRQKVIMDAAKNITVPSKITFPAIVRSLQSSETAKKQIDLATQSVKKVSVNIERILKNPSKNDEVYKCLNKLFRKELKYMLREEKSKEYFRILSKARRRALVGKPPIKKGIETIGDAINWEWIVYTAINDNSKSNVIIVSRDGDYGVKYKNEIILNDWLQREFKDRVSQKRRISVTDKLTTALKSIDEGVNNEDIRLEEKLLDEYSKNLKEMPAEVQDIIS